MAGRIKTNGLNSMHTAGIFSDMTVDGPEIGTLVVVVDRAKNLPSRKTIGKQDPYCAARLGKEAKKTETDRRGGQTPKWDQELRFTVHDSADYYQLKVSVFNDDKKTDLIGETWVSLQDVVVPGGGLSDVWHNLNCKGKYAGEIRIEITYYDTRPKQEKPEKAKQKEVASGVEDGARDSLKGPRQPKAAVKRRPLPSDPVTGAPPPPPAAIPDHVQTPPRGYKAPAGNPEYVQTPPRGHEPSPNEYGPTPPRGQPPPPNAIPEYIQPQSRGQPASVPQHIQTPPRAHPSPGYMSNQSPLQNLEYGTSASQYSANGYEGSPGMNGYPAPKAVPHAERNELYDLPPRKDRMDHSPGYDNHRGRYEEEEEYVDPRDEYTQHSPYELPQPEEFGSPPSPGGPPPPPPAHGGRHGSINVSPQPSHRPQDVYDFPRPSRASTWDTTPSKEVHRSSMSYAQPKPYMAYVTPKKDDQYQQQSTRVYQEEPRHHSYDANYNPHYGSMQPTVEDAPPSPSGRYNSSTGHRGSTSQSTGDGGRGYDKVPSPAPLNLSGRGSVASRNSGSNAPSYQPSHQFSGSTGYQPSSQSNSQISIRDRSHTGTSLSSRTSYNAIPQQQQYQLPRKTSRNEIAEMEPDYGLPPVPATLVAGMDPTIAQEISERIYDERRKSFGGQSPNPMPYGGYQEASQYHQSQSNYQDPQRQNSYREDATVPYTPQSMAHSSSYDERQSRHSASIAPSQKSRGISPIPRKSVSPAPPRNDEQRRLSGVPFGPDSYNALNPKISGSTSTLSLSAKYDTDADPNAKIITHDGREIDPSDHIPESNYAPLLESKGPKYASQLPDRNYRGPDPTSQPSSGRKQLRVAARPVSMAAVPSGPAVYMGTGPNDPLAQNGRNRLQKKSNRMAAQESSPLTPISPHQSNGHTPRSASRPTTSGYGASENYSPTPSYGGSYRGGAGPPIPAKVPYRMDSGPPSQPASENAWALLEEMKNIDLGSGRARRRGY